MDTSGLFSILFCFVFIISLFLGIYVLYLGSGQKLNRVFFVCSVTLDIWAFSFAIAVSAPDMATCLFWRRFSAFGWSFFYSTLLHFILVLTKKEKLLKKFYTYIFLYLPSVITVIGYSFFPSVNPTAYVLVREAFGWVNLPTNNSWDTFFNSYYMIFSILGLILIWSARKKSPDLFRRKQITVFFLSYLPVVLVGTYTDVIGSSISSVVPPQIGPLLLLFPLCAVYYSIKKLGLMNPKLFHKETVFITNKIREQIMNSLSAFFFIFGFFAISAPYLSNGVFFLPNRWISIMILISAVVLLAAKRARISDDAKDSLTVLMLSVSVPFILLQYLKTASVTVWAFPMFMLILSLIFPKRSMRLTLSISIVVSQIMVWAIASNVTLTITAVDYVFRLVISITAIFLSNFVYKIYTARLSENEEQLRIQSLIAEISTDFLGADDKNFDTKIRDALDNMAIHYSVDRAFLFLFDRRDIDGRYLKKMYISQTALEPKERAGDVSFEFPWLENRISSYQNILISDLENVSCDMSEAERTFFEKTMSLAAMPVIRGKNVCGVIGIDSAHFKNKWSENQIHSIKTISNIVAEALIKIEQEKEINHMAYYDILTDLPNLTTFKEQMSRSIGLARQKNSMVGIIFIDLDSFKLVNDALGHVGGDELLKIIAAELKENVRDNDIVGRFAGDEFIVLIDQVNSVQEITVIAENLLRLFNRTYVIRGQNFNITASAGIAAFPDDGEEPEQIIRYADLAMYNAKENGKNRLVLCSTEIKNKIMIEYKLLNSLTQARERQELELFYQPQVSVKTKNVDGLEALIRWRHPEMGMVPPDMFIYLAEQGGQINSIGEWVLKTACMQSSEWMRLGLPKLRICVNVSIYQLRNPNFVSIVKDILRETKADPKYIELEITETSAIQEPEYIIQVLNDLKKTGLTISVDDYGTEYSSLSRLILLPVDRIKLDKQFIRGIISGEKERAIIVSTISLAHNLGLEVVAEGVETKPQFDFLSEYNCDEIQGFYFYRPSPADYIESVLKKSASGEVDYVGVAQY